MKSTGIVRKVDALGRVVIPKELRTTLYIDINNSLEIFTEDDKIILRKYEPSCIFCGQAKNVTSFRNKNICRSCINDFKSNR